MFKAYLISKIIRFGGIRLLWFVAKTLIKSNPYIMTLILFAYLSLGRLPPISMIN